MLENVIKKNREKILVGIISTLLIIAFNFAFSQVNATMIDENSNDTNNLTNGAEATAINISEEMPENNSSSIKSIFDTKALNGIYKVSDDKLSYLPFIRYAADRILVDRAISGMGTMFSAATIEVNSPMKGLQVMFANDTVRVNSNMEYGIIFASNDVIIDSTFDKPLIVFAGKKLILSENAILNDDLICYSDNIEINGKIKGSLLGGANNITVNGTIEKDLRVGVTNIELKDENSVSGNVYIQTYNEQLNIKEKYPNASVNIYKDEKKALSYEVIMNSIISCLLFTLVYLVINRKTKGKLYEIATSKVKKNVVFVILSGSIALLAMPAFIVLLILLSVFGLYAITLPLLIVYVFGILVIGLLSALIVGSLISNYMSKNYFKDKSASLNAVGTFFVFMSLQILAKLPYIGMYVTMALVLLSIGIVLTYILKKDKNTTKSSDKDIE